MRFPVLLSMAALALGAMAWPLRTSAHVAPASPGVPMPRAYFEVKERDPDAFTFEKAWKGVTERARQERRAASPASAAKASPGLGEVTGHYEVPVLPVLYDDTAGAPWPVLDLQQALFGGGSNARTLSDYYNEISGSRISVDGSVETWHSLPELGSYYEGTSNGLDPSNAKVGELIQHTLDAWDASIDFGLYDNDGPDGVPNSGDDDGYVDFVAFVHPEAGAECGGSEPSIWSHRWRYAAWPASGGLPYLTEDAAANGGVILVNDYVIQPALACNGVDRIEIGVFCHEFGHAFGLPDLYDTNGGGSSGLGHWCLMASGNWNVPAEPAHMSAWTKRELGWVETETVSWEGTTFVVPPVETSGTIFELGFTDERWRRSKACAITGNTSMAAGLDSTESAARGWPSAMGYGNGWQETVAHDFEHDGLGPVTLQYDYAVDTEAGFDFAFALFEKDGVETTLAIYDGQASGSASHDLSALLGPDPCSYRVKFRFRSDAAYSNEDGNFDCRCAPFVVDDVRVSGGGVFHFATFEEHRDGWYQPRNAQDNPPSECWLVENRQRLGYDANLHGEGLMIYHVDQEIMDSALRNSGGASDLAVRGVVVEEADGQADLLAVMGGNRGDGGDPWPGSSGAASFDSLSIPASTENDGCATSIALTGIVALGDSIQVTLRGGDPAPFLVGMAPASLEPDSALVDLELVDASNLAYGAQVRLVRTGQPEILPVRVEWLDHDRVSARFQLVGAAPGAWDVVVENPDGQTAVADSAFTVEGDSVTSVATPNRPVAFSLSQNHPNPFNPRTTIRFSVATPGDVALDVYDARGRHVRSLVRGQLSAGHHEVVWNARDDGGAGVASGLYFARMRAPGFTAVKKMLLAQ